ncbi:GTP-binding protein Rho1 [Serendipita sp. 399]|nr:GTP-binding protein Rho1 [Serendipita sp. 399]
METKAESPPISRKVVLVGDSGVGKTRLMIRFHCGDYHEYHIPFYEWSYLEDIRLDGKQIDLLVQDTSGNEEWNNIRQSSYPDTHVFLLCFSVDNPSSLESVKTKWLPEILHFLSGHQVPYFLVGCRKDLRHDRRAIAAFERSGSKFLSPEEGKAMAQSITAVDYIECSAYSGEGVNELFANATRVALFVTPPKKQRKGCIVI